MNQMPQIQIKLLRPHLLKDLPEYGTSGSAAIDLCAIIEKDLVLKPNKCELVPTGLAVHISNPDLAGLILPRSGLGHKKGLILGNSVGLIDSDYQGELMVSCWNRSEETILIEPLMRFAQFVLVPVIKAQFIQVDNFEHVSQRGVGGFGHTGVR